MPVTAETESTPEIVIPEVTASEKALSPEALAAAHGHKVGEKCGECAIAMPVYQAYGGATSFAELDAYMEAAKMQGELNEASWQFQEMQGNIFRNEEMDASEKADALAALAEEFRDRIRELPEAEAEKALTLITPPPANREPTKVRVARPQVAQDIATLEKAGRRMGGKQAGVFKQAMEALKSLMKWADYEDGASDDEETKTKELVEGFKVYKDANGAARWVAVSSNAFEDHDGELMTTKALENAVAFGDASGERGPLRLFHVAGADIGNCDFQAVVDGMLLESGTFYANEMGQKAARYFEKNAGTKFGVSLGFLHRIGDELDGQYDWIRIRERSITPPGKAANPFTEFALGGIPMGEINKEKLGFLSEVLGTKEAEGIIANTQAASKALQEAGVRFKEAQASTAEGEAPAGETPAPTGSTTNGGETPAEGAGTDDEQTEAQKALRTLVETVGGLAEAVKSIAPIMDSITELRAEVAALKESDDSKIAAQIGPRRVAPTSGIRPTEKASNVTAEQADAIAKRNKESSADLGNVSREKEGEDYGDAPVSPYVNDMLSTLGIKTVEPAGAASV